MKRVFVAIVLFLLPSPVFAADYDHDGLADEVEVAVYRTDPFNYDTDKDGFSDGVETAHGYDPHSVTSTKLKKKIVVSLKEQELAYFLGSYQLGKVKVSTGKKATPTPKGEFSIDKKIPVHLYAGPGYRYPNTKWNLRFKQGGWGNYYIHGAYWHNKFGTPRSAGCVNVSYTDMPPLYEWAEVGTKVVVE